MANVVQRRTISEQAEQVGSALRRKRMRVGLTQEELARRADVSVGTVKGLEHGTGSSVRSLIRVSRALGAEEWIDALVLEEEPQVSPMKMLLDRESPRRSRRGLRAD